MKLTPASIYGFSSALFASQISWIALIVVPLTLLAGAAPTGAQVLTTVIKTGDAVTGLPVGVTYLLSEVAASHDAQINDAGVVLFSASLQGPGVVLGNRKVLIGGTPGSLAVIGREGDVAPDGGSYPGSPCSYLGSVITFPISFVLGAGTDLALFADLNKAAASCPNSVFSGDPLVLRAGDGVAPLVALSQMAHAGSMIGLTALTGTSPFPFGYLVGAPGSPQILAANGDAAPGIASAIFDDVDLASFSNLTPPLINSAGQMPIAAQVSGGGSTTSDDTGLWFGAVGALALVARENDPAPGMPVGAVFDDFTQAGSISINDAGELALPSRARGGGLTPSVDDAALWIGPAGSLSLLLRAGDPAPGVPGEFFPNGFGSTKMNGAGELLIRADTQPSGTPRLFAGPPGSLALVASAGDPAPGLPGFEFVMSPTTVLGRSGQVAFADQAVDPITFEGRDGIWATDSTGALCKVVVDGDVIEVAPGDFREANVAPFAVDGSGGEDGREHMFNASGQLVFDLSFTDDTFAVMLADTTSCTPAVPLSSIWTLALVAAGIVATGMWYSGSRLRS